MASSSAETPHVSINMGRPIRKVCPELRMKSKMLGGSSPYDPVMVSLGPHHHGKPELQKAEDFKKISLEEFLGHGEITSKEILKNRILGKIDLVRNSYDDVPPVNAYNDKYHSNNDDLAEMMLLDACFIIRYMELRTSKKEDDVWKVWRQHLGDAGCHRFAERDIMVLENQIPLFVLKLVMFEKYKNKEKGNELVDNFLGWALFMELGKPLKLSRENEDHILAAFRQVLIEKADNENAVNEKASITQPQQNYNHQSLWRCCKPENRNNNYYTCGSVTDLKGKGIYVVGKRESYNLLEIEYQKNPFYGKLQLPVRYISDGTLVNFSNMIAYEICPRSEPTNLEVCSYISLMKSLIQTPADVKELQETGVFGLNTFANQEHVVDMFKTFDTLDLVNTKIYADVMNTIGRHSKNKIKTWIAYDLLQTALRSPCTTIAWLSAITFFAMACVSIYFTIHPVRRYRY